MHTSFILPRSPKCKVLLSVCRLDDLGFIGGYCLLIIRSMYEVGEIPKHRKGLNAAVETLSFALNHEI